MNQEKFILILFALLISSACRTRKESTYTQNRLEALVHGQHVVQWQQADSNLRYWYYQSDSAFYFHPDSGLYGLSGWLAVGEKQMTNHYGTAYRDTATYWQEELVAGNYKSESKGSYRLYWYLFGAGLAVFILFRFWRNIID